MFLIPRNPSRVKFRENDSSRNAFSRELHLMMPFSGRKHAKVIYCRLSASKIPSPWSLYDSRNAMESTFSVSFYGFSHMVIQSIS